MIATCDSLADSKVSFFQYASLSLKWEDSEKLDRLRKRSHARCHHDQTIFQMPDTMD